MIPVLGALLYWVINKDNNSDETNEAGFTNAKPTTTLNQPVEKPSRRDIVWPDLTIEDLLQRNPFTRGIQIVKSDGVENQPVITTTTGPQQIEISVFMDSAQGPVAMIDGQIVHEGDRLANGQFITKLTPEYALISEQL